VSAELTENARIINNIASIPNRVNLSRNQIYNESYVNHLNEIEERSRSTSIRIGDLASLFAKPSNGGEAVSNQNGQHSSNEQLTDSNLNEETNSAAVTENNHEAQS
jgi:hypothetical protein